MRHLALAAFILASPSFACPDLAGSYPTCRLENGTLEETSDVIVSQVISEGFTNYLIESSSPTRRFSELYTADGKTVYLRETDSGVSGELATTTTCLGSEALEIHMKLSFNDQLVSEVRSTISKSGAALKQVAVTKYANGREFVQTSYCQ